MAYIHSNVFTLTVDFYSYQFCLNAFSYFHNYLLKKEICFLLRQMLSCESSYHCWKHLSIYFLMWIAQEWEVWCVSLIPWDELKCQTSISLHACYSEEDSTSYMNWNFLCMPWFKEKNWYGVLLLESIILG